MAKQKTYVTLEKGGVMVATPKTGLKNAVNRTARDVAYGIAKAPKKVANSFRDTKERREGYLANKSNKSIKKVPAVKSGTKD